MIEKIRISLWDIFSFFLTGLVIVSWFLALASWLGDLQIKGVAKYLSTIPASVSLFLAPLALTALGMIFEPISNYFDRLINSFWFKVFPKKEKHREEEEVLKSIIVDNYLGPLKGRITNPYHICKEYVETKELSTTFMVFLSRYGFYRNIAFLMLLTVMAVFITQGFTLASSLFAALFFVLYIVMKLRAEEFYTYLAPTVYRCYLVDKALKNNGSET